MNTLLIAILTAIFWWLAGFTTGIYCGMKGILCDGRLVLLQRKELGLMAELSALIRTTEAYGHFMVLNHMGRKPGNVCRELAETRAAIIRCGAQPRTLKPDMMDILVESTNQEKGKV